MRDGNVTGSENAPVPAFASPLPSITDPCPVHIHVPFERRHVTPPEFEIRLEIADCQICVSILLLFVPVMPSCTPVPISPSTIHAIGTQRCPGAGVVGYRIQTSPADAAARGAASPASASAADDHRPRAAERGARR